MTFAYTDPYSALCWATMDTAMANSRHMLRLLRAHLERTAEFADQVEPTDSRCHAELRVCGHPCRSRRATVPPRTPPATAASIRDRIGAYLTHDRIDMARALAHESHNESMIALVDAAAVRYVLQPSTARMQRFRSTVMPTADNLIERIRARCDTEAEMLLRMGARLPADEQGRGALLSLFESQSMPRTINYMCEHRLLPTSVGWEHVEACINTGNVRLVRELMLRDEIAARFEALSEAAKARMMAMHFYWSARHLLRMDADSEMVADLRHVVRTEHLSDNEVALLLRQGDCWRELPTSTALQLWKSGENQFTCVRPLRPLLEEFGGDDGAKVDYQQFYMAAIVALRAAYPDDARFQHTVRILSLPTRRSLSPRAIDCSRLPLAVSAAA